MLAAHLDIANTNFYHFYLCGPGAFITELQSGLLGHGVARGSIRYKRFGLSSEVTRTETLGSPRKRRIDFARSCQQRVWYSGDGDLLSFAMSQGIKLLWVCRMDECRTCLQKLASGYVAYHAEPEDLPDGFILLC